MLAIAVAVTLALSFLGSQSTAVGISRNRGDHARARHVAESGLELTLEHLRTSATWRTDHPNGTWTADKPFRFGTTQSSL